MQPLPLSLPKNYVTHPETIDALKEAIREEMVRIPPVAARVMENFQN